MNEVFERFEKTGIIPVVVLDDAADAPRLAQALVRGGLPAAEVTFRTPAAAAGITAMKKACPELLVGAGTVLSPDQVNEAMEAGAQFIVSPGTDEEVIRYCLEKKIPVCPGTSCPSDVQTCYRLGLDTVKFFPAEAAGGLKMIRAIAAPYPMMKFMPTGGISEKNMKEYLESPEILCVGGSWMVKKDLIRDQKFDEIEELCRKAVQKVREVQR